MFYKIKIQVNNNNQIKLACSICDAKKNIFIAREIKHVSFFSFNLN